MPALMNTTAVRTILSVWAWVWLATLLVVALPTVAVIRLVTAPFDRGAYAAGYCFRKIAVAHQVLNPLWSFRVSGEMPADRRRPWVVVANHESFVDMILISHLPIEMKWVAKSEFFRIPVVGQLLRLVRDIRLVRGSEGAGERVLADAAERLSARVSVMLFPEGTRSATGELGDFKSGAFRIAIANGVPILPLAVHGTRSALVKHDWRFGVSSAEVRVLPPVPTEGLTMDDVDALRTRVRTMIADELATMSAAG
ncbi:MAG: lysophospholipid acyltransferase family protein [Ilumatobacteraceae bacterium]